MHSEFCRGDFLESTHLKFVDRKIILKSNLGLCVVVMRNEVNLLS
jgi:hypothetical protein